MKTQPLRVKLREATGNAILDAAEEVAAREGSGPASLQAIAAQAGIAVGTIYNYFEDKDELFAALFARRREEMFAVIDASGKRHSKQPFAAQLDGFVRTVFVHFDSRRAFLRLALEHETNPHAEPLAKPKLTGSGKQTALKQLQERAQSVVRIGVREKQLRNDDTADLLATVLVAIVRGVLLQRATGDKPFAAETDRAVSLFLHGARAAK